MLPTSSARAAVRLSALAGLAVAAGALPAPAPAATLPAGSTAILSGTPALDASLPAPVSHATSDAGAVSQDGRYVAFVSTSDGLVAEDDDRIDNVYVKDRVTGAVVLASRATGPAGEPAHQNCFDAAISDDGRRVAFSCYGPLDPADGNGVSDVYLRDLTTQQTVLVSRAGGLGAVGDDASRRPALDQDGDSVAFVSNAMNLEAVGTHDDRVYRRRIGGADGVTLVSRRSATSGNGPMIAADPAISDDGERIAFTAAGASTADPGDTNATQDVYLRDLPTASTTLVSRADGGAGAAGNKRSYDPAIAGNGSAVAFESEATNLAPDDDAESGADIYRRSLTTGATALVSITAAGAKGQTSTSPSIDDSGWRIGFVSAGTTLDPADTDPSPDVYLKDAETSTMTLVSRRADAAGTAANAGARSVAVSGDGKRIAFTVARGITPDADPHRIGVALRDLGATPAVTVAVSRPAGTGPFRNAGGTAGPAALSADGRYAAFYSEAPALGLPDDVDAAVFVRDRVTGAVVLASRADGPDGAPLAVEEAEAAISADGRRVAFIAGDLAWVRDLPSGRTLLASRADGAGGAPADGAAIELALDRDGSRLAFSTTAANLGDGDAESGVDVHVRDLASGRTLLASRAPGGAKADGPSLQPDLDASGTRVSFISGAKNLPGGGGFSQAYVRDLAAGTTLQVSVPAPEFGPNVGASEASIDAAGRRVAYTSPAPVMAVPGAPVSIVLVRDLATGATVLAGRADDGSPAGGDAYDPAISPDGNVVAFASTAALVPGVPAGVQQVYRRDLVTARTALVSRATGAAGRPQAAQAGVGSLSNGGRCVSFTTADGLAGPRASHRESYLRTFAEDCAAPANGPGGGGGLEPRDTAAPVLSRVRLDRKRLGGRRAAVLRFRVSEAATVRVVVQRRRGGRFVRAGVLRRAVPAAGPGRLRVSRRVGGRRLTSGRYRLVVTAADAAGNRSAAARLRLRVVSAR